MDAFISILFDLLYFFLYDIICGLLFLVGSIVVKICSFGRYPREPMTIWQEAMIYSAGVLVFAGLLAVTITYRLQ